MRDRACRLGDRQLRLQRAGDPCGDFVLQREQIPDIAVEPFRPELGAGRRIDQLGIDPHFLARTLHAAFDDIAHVELMADPARVDFLALVGKGGVARDHDAALDPRQIGDQIVGNAVGEILLLRVVAEIGERQNHHRQPRRRIGQLIWRDRRRQMQPPRRTRCANSQCHAGEEPEEKLALVPTARPAHYPARAGAPFELIGAHGFGDVFDVLLTEAHKADRQPVADLIAHRTRQTHAARFGQRLEPRGDIDAVAVKV